MRYITLLLCVLVGCPSAHGEEVEAGSPHADAAASDDAGSVSEDAALSFDGGAPDAFEIVGRWEVRGETSRVFLLGEGSTCETAHVSVEDRFVVQACDGDGTRSAIAWLPGSASVEPFCWVTASPTERATRRCVSDADVTWMLFPDAGWRVHFSAQSDSGSEASQVDGWFAALPRR